MICQKNGPVSMMQSRLPSPSEVGGIVYSIVTLFIIDDDHDTTLVTEFILVGVWADHLPGYTSVSAQKGIALLVR